MTGRHAVWAVVVSYQPDPGLLDCLLARLAPQVERIVVVDDGSSETAPIETLCRHHGQVEFHSQGFNGGLARAQNAGIRRALDAGARQVILFDQDSEPAPDLVTRLQFAIETLSGRGLRVGAVGANYEDAAHTPFRRIRGPWIQHCRCNGNDCLPRVDYLIASGCLVPAEVLRAVGDMNEALFIDYVDTEWSLRAVAAGYSLHGVCDARMRHRLGDARIALGGRSVALHSPLRHYYMFRNALWLYRQPGLPGRWKLADGIRLTARFFTYALAGPARLRQVRAMLRGLGDGLRGRLGRAPWAP